MGQCLAVHLMILRQRNIDIFFPSPSNTFALFCICTLTQPEAHNKRMLEKKWPFVLEARSTACWPAWARTGHFLLLSVYCFVQEQCLLSDRLLSTCSDSSQEQNLRPSSELAALRTSATETYRGRKCGILSLGWRAGKKNVPVDTKELSLCGWPGC